MRRHHKILFALIEPLLSRSLRHPNLILVLGCMRSGSSLLTHILSSNPEIAGFGESHVRYHSRESLSELAYWVLRFRRRWPGHSRYLLDKVLHHDHLPDLRALSGWASLKVIFLVRSPEGNAQSLQKMFGGERAGALNYYTGRMRELLRDLDDLPETTPVLSVKYEDLTADPDRDLRRITRFLELETPLKTEYRLHGASGRWGVGDGSSAIRAGVILKRQEPTQAPSGAAEKEAREAYDALLARLLLRCGDALPSAVGEIAKNA